MSSVQSILRRRTTDQINRKLGLPESADSESSHGLGHVVPIPVLVGVLVALLFLTFITVAVTWIDLGAFNVWLALGIAVVKAALVCLYFMHLRYDNPYNGLALIASLVFVALFLAIVILDSRRYQPNIKTVTTSLSDTLRTP